MNRRNFFGNLLKSGAGFAILPAATLYARKWKFDRAMWVPNPEWEKAQYSIAYCGFTSYFIDESPIFDERILAQV